MRKCLIFIFIILIFSAGARAQSAPIQAGGSFSQTSDSSAPMSKADLEKEIASLRALFAGGEYSTIIRKIYALKERGESDPRFNLYMAQAFEASGDIPNALYCAQEAIAENPKDPRGFLLRAKIYFQQKDYENARIDIKKAASLSEVPSRRLVELQNALAALEPSAQTKTDAALLDTKKKNQEKNNRVRWILVYIAAVFMVIGGFWFIRRASQEDGSAPQRRFGKKLDIKEQYNFIRQIGEGGMGKVYEAYDGALKRRVAVKRVRPELVRSDYVRGQFLSEARTVALLRHPNIVEIYTVIETDNSLYLVFEYMDGQTLETRLDIDGYIPFSEAKYVFEDVCAGLQYAHSQDIIHCDLKPGNIMISDDGPAKVMDFGVAKKVTEGEVGARTVAGTPAYMAPEQQKGFMKKQSDVFSLGVCLYEALAGQVPWSVAGFDIANKKIVPPSQIAPEIPKEVDELLAKALKENPKERVQSVDEFWSLLRAIEPLENKFKPPVR